MLIPLGLGHWPPRLAIATLLLMLVIGIQSNIFSTNVENFKNEVIDFSVQSDHEGDASKLVASFCVSRKENILDETIEARDFSTIFKETTKSVECVTKYLAPPEEWSEEQKNAPGANDLAEKILNLKLQKEGVVLTAANKNNLLSGENYSLKSLWYATFMHAGIVHLFGNLLILFLFGIFVESRAGKIALVSTFLIGSFVGLSLHTLFYPVTPVLGASAGVTAILGLFLVLFFHSRMKFIATFFFFLNRSFYLSVPIATFLFYIGQDLILALGGISTGVAHLAHVGGFFVGVVSGFIVKKHSPLPRPFIYKEEQELFKKMQLETNDQLSFNLAVSILKLNPFNSLVLDQAISKMHKIDLLSNDLPKEIWNILAYKVLRFNRRNELTHLLNLIESLPEYVGLHTLLSEELLWSDSLKLADHAVKLQRYTLAIKIYSLLLKSAPEGADVAGIYQTCQNIYNQFPKLKTEIPNLEVPIHV